MSDEITIRLSRDDYQWLLIMAGYAYGAASKLNDADFADRFLRLAETIRESRKCINR